MAQFSIRELMLITLVVAIGAAWWLDRRGLKAAADHHQREATTLQLFIRDIGYDLEYVDHKPTRIFKARTDE